LRYKTRLASGDSHAGEQKTCPIGASDLSENQEIVVVKKRPRHADHHGGAWKVAYADFVTAMMALFIVLWLMNGSKPVKDAVGSYFRDPRGVSNLKGSDKYGAADIATLRVQKMQQLKAELLRSIHRLDPLDKLKNQIEITITQEGLRIELMESAKGTFFEMGSAKPTSALREILQVLSPELGKLANTVSIEGHTDSRPYALVRTYDNWDLSSDRANEARRLMQTEGLRPNQISQVRGFANQRPRLPQNPEDPSNRRISVIVQYQVTDVAEATPPQIKNGQ
jgi:chemotaxis protein MotB